MVFGNDPTQQTDNNAVMMKMTAERRSGSVPAKKRKIFELDADANGAPPPRIFNKKETDPRSRGARQHRLAQNRKAARESRKRKKAMVEELQRSLVFFSKANAALRNEYQDLTRKILTAHAELSKLGLPIPESAPTAKKSSAGYVSDASAAISTGYVPPRAVVTIDPMMGLPPMEPGATMQGELPSQQPLWSL